MKKELLIIGTARNNKIDENLIFIKRLFKKKIWNYSILLTKKYNNNLINEYIYYDKNFFSEKDYFDFSSFHKIVMCQSGSRFDYLNVLLFLKNNGVKKIITISTINEIRKYDIKKNLNFVVVFLLKKLKIYNKMGF